MLSSTLQSRKQQKNGLICKWEKDMIRNAVQAEIAVLMEKFGNE